MKTKEDLAKDFSKNIRMLLVGTSGSGKTFTAHTFPKTYTINTEPGGMDTVASNKTLFNNVVGYDSYVPESKDDIKNTLVKLKADIVLIKQMAKEGKVETVILDNLTYLAETIFLYYTEVNPIISKGGEVDTRGAYRELDSWLFKFVVFDLLTMPCNVVITCHEKLEDETAMERKVDQSSPIVPNVLGGFRNKIEGMLSIVLYLQKIEQGGKYMYWARANKGNQRNAKNRINLPDKIQNISYNTIIEAINSSVSK